MWTMQTIPKLPSCGQIRGIRRRRAFTLIEILIVVVILGILATIVLPQFSNASQQAKENTLKDELRYLRTQLVVFKAQHRDVGAGYPGGSASATPTEADFSDQLTKYTDENCNVSTTATSTNRFGPYLSKIPSNPLSGLATLTIVGNGSSLPVPDGTTGWIYKPSTQEFMANQVGNDSSGTRYIDY
jgi:general secretion pathway protein G